MTNNNNNAQQAAIQTIIYVLVAAKIDKPLAYTLADQHPEVKPGRLVRVPLSGRTVTGIVCNSPGDSNQPTGKLKPVSSVLPEELSASKELLSLIHWCQRYYHAPIGQIVSAALPRSLLQGRPVQTRKTLPWQLSASSAGNSSPTPKQAEALNWIRLNAPSSSADIIAAGYGQHLISALTNKQLIEKSADENTQYANQSRLIREQLPNLNTEQANALSRINAVNNGFFLLNGVTGSGKTEIYLRVCQTVLSAGKQALMLVPEIGLIEQSIQRLKNRFNCEILNYHSSTAESEKIHCWKQVRKDKPLIVIGTRSSIFLPFSNLSTIIVDEEHDLSYKQQEGFRYHGRDLAVVRATNCQASLILGSATPSLESLNNVERNQFELLELKERIGNRPMPKWDFASPIGRKNSSPISEQTINAIRQQTQSGHQVLVFINRRGFAPVLQCLHCGWRATCGACETTMTLHRRPSGLICHRCDQRSRTPEKCPECGSEHLQSIGLGTEQLEDFLNATFPETTCIRIDRDSTQRKGSFAANLAKLNDNQPAILIGTQMITKGHHLPGISLVVVLEADAALMSHDFRSLEQLAQSLVQVAGRAGRGDSTGKMLIETTQPEHPVFLSLASQSYSDFSAKLLENRKTQLLPPFHYSAVIHANCTDLVFLQTFMQQCQQYLHAHLSRYDVNSVGPMPSPIEKRNNRFRYQIQFYANSRSKLHSLVSTLENYVTSLKGLGKIRLAIDIDPLTMD